MKRKQALRGRNHAEGWLGGRIDALKIPARRAEYSLTENATSPFQAEPTHLRALCVLSPGPRFRPAPRSRHNRKLLRSRRFNFRSQLFSVLPQLETARDSGPAGSEIGGSEGTAEESPPAGRVTNETDYFGVADHPGVIGRASTGNPRHGFE